jgi:hypothetical protein
MRGELPELIEAFNDAVDRFNLSRLAYAMAHPIAKVPPPAFAMQPEGIACTPSLRPVTSTVQSVRDFFEDVYDGTTEADPTSEPFACMHDASLEMTRRFFHVSLTCMGISYREMLD